MLYEWVLPIKATTPVGDRTHDAAADTQARRDLAVRQCALVDQRIDFIHKRDRQHVDWTPGASCGFGISNDA